MTLSLIINETLKWLSSLPILTQESFWLWQCSDRCIISVFPHLHTHFPVPKKPYSLLFVDVKHHVYFSAAELRSCVKEADVLGLGPGSLIVGIVSVDVKQL